jgi:hypothetical protein
MSRSQASGSHLKGRVHAYVRDRTRAVVKALRLGLL